jgi:predicted PurR-regulated permease PerM
MVVFLVFFLLIGGDTFKRKLVRLTGPSLSKRKITVNILDDINHSIQKYMLMLLTPNLLVALLSWAAFAWIGLDNPVACRRGLRIVPYLGPVVTAAATRSPPSCSSSRSRRPAGRGRIDGNRYACRNVRTTWCGWIAHMNSAAVFISLLFWG